MTLVITSPRSDVLVAPRDGIVRLHPPRALCGELEVFEAGEPICHVDDAVLEAPSLCFIQRVFVRDGDEVVLGTKIVELSRA